MLDAEPQFGDGREENHKAHADKLLVKSDPRQPSARTLSIKNLPTH